MIRFDPLGALVAVASSSGLIRIYDFDEYLFNERRQLPLTLKPVSAVDTRKDIGDVRWSVDSSFPDDIFVSFLHGPLIHVYDISTMYDVSSPKAVLQVRAGHSGS